MSSSHFNESFGDKPQFVGQVDNTSIREKPLPSIWFLKACKIAFFAFLIFLILLTLLFTNIFCLGYEHHLPKGSLIKVATRIPLTTEHLEEGSPVYFISSSDVWVVEKKAIEQVQAEEVAKIKKEQDAVKKAEEKKLKKEQEKAAKKLEAKKKKEKESGQMSMFDDLFGGV